MYKHTIRSFCLILLFFIGGLITAQNRNARNQVQNAGDDNRLRAAQIAASMDIKTLAAQVLLTAVDGKETVPPKTRELLTGIPAGGIVLLGYNVSPDPEKSRIFLQELSRCVSVIPPFIASDQEGGGVQRFRGKAALPPPLSYWEKLAPADTIEKDAAEAGRELRRIGVTLNLAPLAELLTAENQPFLKARSYGPDPAFTAGAAAAFVRGMQTAGVASTLKHFPGHSTADPHHNKSVLGVSGAELERHIDIFGEVMRRERPAAVMLSHAIVPSWDTLPSSFSPVAVKRLRDMGFTGIIIADDFSMAGAGQPSEVCAVKALAAGVDMIFTWPNDVKKIHQAILTALSTGNLTEGRVRNAAEQIIYQKIRYGLLP